MISAASLQPDHIVSIARQNRKVDPGLVEKVIRALLLLEGLVEQQIGFVFKGGTALMLKLESTKRLSIDIDIIIPQKDDLLEQKLQKIAQDKGFNSVELHQQPLNSDIEKAHYKFRFTPTYHSGIKEDHILLDILYEKIQYTQVETVEMVSPFLIQEGSPLKVQVPSFEDLMGDKLTAFAPETTGIPYEKKGQSKAMEIIKQLYDIGNIFDHIQNLPTVSQVFERFASTELSYRGLDIGVAAVIDDIYQTALTISTRGKEGSAHFHALQQGISQVKAFIFSESYHIDKAIVQASKAAYMAKLLAHKATGFYRFDGNPMPMKDWLIEAPFYTRLNRLKKSNPEAFYYWYRVYELETAASS